jgi:hypothetical protein
MGLLFLVIMGGILINHGFIALGIISIIVGLNRFGEKHWSIILGVILMVTPGWFAVGVLSMFVGAVSLTVSTVLQPSSTHRRRT